MPEKTTLIDFADDIVRVVTPKLVNTANVGLQRVVNCMERKMLKLAPEKTEAVLLLTKQEIQLIAFNIGSTTVQISKIRLST